MTNGELFDPALYAATLAEFGVARTLPASCYTDPDFHRREIERCFKPNWHFIGHESEIAEPGDYISTDLVIGPVIVNRGQDGGIRAFANTCRHRGARLLEAGQGRCKTIVCPYHAWTYALDGTLSRTPRRLPSDDFDARNFSLYSVGVFEWAGFAFINLGTEQAVSAEQALDGMPSRFSNWQVSD